MSVKIRLSKIGKTNRPYWRVVAMDTRKKRDGAYLDNLGTYDPITHEIIKIDLEGIKGWVAKGAQCSPTVKKIIKMSKKTTSTEVKKAAPKKASKAKESTNVEAKVEKTEKKPAETKKAEKKVESKA